MSFPRSLGGVQASRLGLPLEVRYHDGRIEIEPAALNVRLERDGRLVVAVPESDPGNLTLEMVEGTREAIRDGRETS